MATYTLNKLNENEVEVAKTEGGKYIVQLKPFRCTCPAYQFRRTRCKHMDLVKPARKVSTTTSEKYRMPREKALTTYNNLAEALAPFCIQIAMGGSLARGKETVGDVDLLVQPIDTEKLNAHIQTLGRMKCQGKGQSYFMFQDVQINLWYSDGSNWGTLNLYAVGSKDHNMKMRSKAKSMGLSLSQNGLFRGTELITTDEMEVFRQLGMPYVAPINR